MADKADYHARLAVERDPDDAMGLAFAAHVESFLRRRFESAERLYERAVAVNPSFGWAWVLRAMLACYRGRPDTALEYFSHYNKLSPFDFYRYFWETVAVIAYALKGQHREAIAAAEPVLRDHAQFGAIYVPVISSLGHLGRLDEAARRIAQLREVRPEFSIANFNATYPMEDPAQFAIYIQGLRLAGVAET